MRLNMILLACLLSIWGCDDGGGDTGEGSGGAGGGSGEPLGPIGDGQRISLSVGPEGGTLTLPGASLTVPAGALSETVELYGVATTDDPTGDFTRHSPVFRFGPPEVRFEIAASLRVAYTGRPRPTVLFWALEGEGFGELPAQVDGDTVIAEITRLGSSFVGTFGAPPPPSPDAAVGGAGGGADMGVEADMGGFGGGGPVTDDCGDVEVAWQDSWTERELEVLRLTNQYRAQGYNCDTMGEFGPAGPLTLNRSLRCAARLHSQDMAEQGYFEHESLDGRSPFQRMQAAGYSGGFMGENIAAGQISPAAVVADWMDSDGHCANIMNANFTELGVGYFQSNTAPFPYYWTQNFGAP